MPDHARPGASPVVGVSRRNWPLTSRETEVLAAMAAGKTNAAIAEFLFISRKAVEKHVSAIFYKLVLNTRDEWHPRVAAVLLYLDHVHATSQQIEAPARRAAVHHGGRHGRMTHPRCRP